MTRKLRGVFGVLLGLALVLGLVPGVVATAWADGTAGTQITAETRQLSAGTYYINEDTTITGELQVSSGDVVINLNGHSLNQSSSGTSVIYVTDGNLIVNNGTITGGDGGHEGKRGGGFCVSGGAVTVNDVTITENTASWGGGVYMGSGSFTMNNSHIDANHSVTDGNDWHDGGGAYLDGGIFTMNDGTIRNNTVTANKKNGLVLANSSARLNISGNAYIYNNKSTDGSTQQNLHADALFGGKSPLYVTGQLGESAKIGITSALNQVFTSSENTVLNDPTKFVSDNSDYRIARNDDGQLMLAKAYETIAVAAGYEGKYDKEGHGITVTVTDPADEYTITYGETEGTYNLTQSPAYVDAGTYTVYYKIEAYNYTTKTGFAQVVIGPADNPASVTGTASVVRGGNTVDLASNVTMNGATGNVSYEIDGDANGCSLDGSILRSGNDVGSVTVNVTVSEDGNYKSSDLMPITVTIGDKKAQTITASNVTATYGDTDKKVNASVTNPTTGGGAISYAVKSGSEEYIGVDASTGALTIKKVPADRIAYVTVTAAETDTHDVATKDVAVTVNKAEPAYTTPGPFTVPVGTKLGDVALPTAENGAWEWAKDVNVEAPLQEVGQRAFQAMFTPNDTNNYNTIEAKVTVNVTDSDPKPDPDPDPKPDPDPDPKPDPTPAPEPSPEPKPGPAPVKTFPDVPEDAWFHGVVYRAAGLGLFNGYDNGNFGPNDNVTRGQTAVVLWHMAGHPAAGTGAKQFPDVKAKAYYADAVAWASSVGVVNGYKNGNFGPDDNITREQLAAMLANYARNVGGRDTTGSAEDYKAMKDAAKVSGWAESSVGWCFRNKIMSGTKDGNVNPQGNATRAETAKMTVFLHDMLQQ